MKDGYIISNDGTVTVVTAGKTYNVAVDHVNHEKIIVALKRNDFDAIPKLADISNAITDMSKGEVNVVNGEVIYKDNVIHNTVTDRILDLMNRNFPFEPMVKFLSNLMLNPSFRAINELYTFLDGNKLPITEDGCFLAYKRVNDDYLDFHTGTVDNHIGATPSMLRNEVDEDKDRTCSNGFHFCSLNYLSDFHKGQGHIMIVKVNPKDVVSIPSDCHNTKGRCSDYIVVGEHVVDEKVEPAIPEKFESPLYNADMSDFEREDNERHGWVEEDDLADYDNERIVKPTLGVKPSGQAFHNVRDNSGKFTKSTLGVKPSGQAFHNVRDRSGRFTSR